MPNDLSIKKEVVHKKTGNKYIVLSDTIINCTNKDDGQRMVLYTRNDMLFVREYSEFREKFDF